MGQKRCPCRVGARLSGGRDTSSVAVDAGPGRAASWRTPVERPHRPGALPPSSSTPLACLPSRTQTVSGRSIAGVAGAVGPPRAALYQQTLSGNAPTASPRVMCARNASLRLDASTAWGLAITSVTVLYPPGLPALMRSEDVPHRALQGPLGTSRWRTLPRPTRPRLARSPPSRRVASLQPLSLSTMRLPLHRPPTL